MVVKSSGVSTWGGGIDTVVSQTAVLRAGAARLPRPPPSHSSSSASRPADRIINNTRSGVRYTRNPRRHDGDCLLVWIACSPDFGFISLPTMPTTSRASCAGRCTLAASSRFASFAAMYLSRMVERTERFISVQVMSAKGRGVSYHVTTVLVRHVARRRIRKRGTSSCLSSYRRDYVSSVRYRQSSIFSHSGARTCGPQMPYPRIGFLRTHMKEGAGGCGAAMMDKWEAWNFEAGGCSLRL